MVADLASSRLLTREQAIDAMMLDELLSDPEADGGAALRSAAQRATSLGMDVAEAVLLLATRVVERDRHRVERARRCRRSGPNVPGCGVPQRFLFRCLSASAVLGRILYAVATLPSLSFVVVALLAARLTSNGWVVSGVTVAASALTCTVTLAGSR